MENLEQKQHEQHEKTENKELQEKYIVLRIEGENFVISLEYVSEIVRVKDLTEAPHQPEWVKGIMNLRDSVISLVDTRKRLSIKSFADDANQFCENAKTAHLNWVKKLEESVINETPFKLALDHTQCEFGKMAVALMNRTDIDKKNNTGSAVRRKLIELEPTHKEVHDGGRVVVALMAQKQKDEALKKVKEISKTLVPKMLTYLDELEVAFQSQTKNIAVIIEYNGCHFAMLADDITEMKTFTPEHRQKGSLTDNPFINGIFDDADGLYQELDLKGILTNKSYEQLVSANEQAEKAEAQQQK